MDALLNILTRKSVRSYEDKPVNRDLINQILNAAEAAPTALGKYEALQVCVVTNKSILGQISDGIEECTGKKGMLYGAPILFVIAFDKTTPTADYAELNCACLADNILHAAHALGLGSVIQMSSANTIAGDSNLRKRLRIEENYIPVMSVCVGHPSSEVLIPKKGRTVKVVEIS